MAAAKRAKQYDLADDYKLHCQTLVMWPIQWQGYKHPASLHWRDVLFSEAGQTKVPYKRGIYAFLIKPGIARLNARYLMYIGKTDRTLRTRYGEYLAEKGSDRGRPQVIKLLQRYEGFIHFCYAPVKTTASLSKLEDQLIEAFVPPANNRLPGRIGRLSKAKF